ncbi:MAG: hypothetical protein MR646_02250 [Agathobacter sp.]|jgi:transcriptional regulator with XRE-family HTH domain|nr:hypothetical protein [Agathobacter sp.]MDY4893539.1 hypothetical protein [Agathobacter sp.]
MKLTESQTIRQPVSCQTETTVTIDSVIRNAIGTRTITQFCENSGLSAGYLSRLLNGKLKSVPSVRTLAKISCASMNGEKVEETFSTLLEISGHHIDKDQMRRELEIAERTSDGIEERRKDEKLENYDIVNLSAAAIGLLFSSLMMMGVSIQPMGEFGPDDGIEFAIKGYPMEKVIAIPGFCGNSNQVTMAERDILEKILKYACEQQKCVPMYLILTDHEDVYEYISEVVEEKVKANVYILLAGRDNTCFVKQKYVTTDGMGEKAPFDFVKDTKQ